MSSFEHVQGLMSEIGPILELRGIVEVVDGDRWVLDLDGEHAIVVEYRPADDRLFFTAKVGIPAPEARSVCYELLLAYNAMWRETGGIRMAVNGEDGAVLQIADMAAGDIDASGLGVILENFIGKLVEWTDILSMDPDGGAGDEASADEPVAVRV